MKIYQKKKQNKRGSTTYGSGSRKKNRGSGNTGGVGKGGIWDHKKGSLKRYLEIDKVKRIQRRKKDRKESLVPQYLSSLKYIKRVAKKGCLINSYNKQITILRTSSISFKKSFIEKIGYKILIE